MEPVKVSVSLSLGLDVQVGSARLDNGSVYFTLGSCRHFVHVHDAASARTLAERLEEAARLLEARCPTCGRGPGN